MTEDMVTFSLSDAREFAVAALTGAGANAAMAASLAHATVNADARSPSAVGFSHLVDYLESLVAGRINGKAEPLRTDPAPALIHVDADGGIAQLGFDLAFDDLAEKARTFGIALFAQANSYTSGELGDYAFRLAEQGLVGIAATNGPALIAGSGGGKPVYCTNPLAFAAPRKNGAPLLIDQSSSATAFVNIREAAARGEPIPAGWAVDAMGQPTTDAKEAMKGAMIAFGGPRGANIALMVEVLAAGLGGANWSLDAPDFVSGDRTPGSGLTVIAIAPSLLDESFEIRLDAQLTRLSTGYGIHIPGASKFTSFIAARNDGIRLPSALVSRISAFAKGRD
ncbi:Ldh family oxidoreductase [Rhizobium herbae]|uniref:(2R)-3-sulfolactate dehydrogenase (NADP+) n=1 Tax=Rhizobium herbae TaxID=508661 RepID=A0ABS4ET75_9HYPH|nr:Ldh family oxidoreductase [Rhizobium herbae]MBP1861150.1 (2R)-3-sulfolactate dehydrogenase (NADP+) [Rhizobium herbae]